MTDQANKLPSYAHLWWAKNRSADTVTDEEIAEALATMSSDPRVVRVEYMGRTAAQGRPGFDIEATDTQEGPLVGLYSIGRCLQALTWTQAGYEAYIGKVRAERRAHYDAIVARQEAEEAERQEAYRRLKAAGYSPAHLAYYVNCLASGRYVDQDHPGSDAFAWYYREIVRGRPQPMRLSLYLANFK